MSKPVILCVDDEKVVLTSLKSQLKRYFGKEYSIETAESGEEALEILEELEDDSIEIPLVISDQIMPGMKGDELLKNVHNKSENTLKILLTGQADAAAVGSAVNNAKLYRYIAKPWEETDLNLTANEAVRSFYQSKKVEEQNRELARLVKKLQEYNEQLEDKVRERTTEVVEQKEIIEEKNRDITASINYAKRIQDAILPDINTIKKYHPDLFVFFRPRDIVSGDFYWYRRLGKKSVLAAVDCTGHGVPGAFMSMIGNDCLHNIVEIEEITDPNRILDELHVHINRILQQSHSRVKDGMDMALCVIDDEKKTVEFSGAKNPLVYIQNGEMNYIRGDKMPIGGRDIDYMGKYTKHTIEITSPATFYIFSDGYQDQFGAGERKKFMIKNLRNKFFEIHQKPFDEQKQLLQQTLDNWRGEECQVDDILVIGFRIE